MASNFYSSWDECPTNLQTLPTFFEHANMSRFQTRWFLHFLFLRHRHATVLEPFSDPARRFLHTQDRRLFTASTNAVPVPSAGTAQEVGPLTSSPPSRGQSLGGFLWRAVYDPGDGQTSPGYSSQSAQCLYINHLLSVNKQVLSYLLLRLLPQWSVYAPKNGQTSPAFSSQSVQTD